MKTRFISFILMLAMIAGASMTADLSAQGTKKYGETPEDSAKCIMNLSLYTEFYKQWKGSGYKSTSVNDAIGPWRVVYNTCPSARLGTYVDGVKMMTYFIKNEITNKFRIIGHANQRFLQFGQNTSKIY